MKIVYINGYNGENSSKPEKLSQILNTEVKHIKYVYGENIDEIVEQASEADLIIASSTGSYIGRYIAEKYNISLISLNPITDKKSLIKTFNKLNVEVPNLVEPRGLLLSEIIFVNRDDELIDYKDTLEKYPNQTIVFKKGTHRFKNLDEIKPYVLNFIKHIYI